MEIERFSERIPMSQISYHRMTPLIVVTMLAFTIMSRPLLARDRSMFEGFWAFCVEQAINETHVPRTNLYEFGRDEILQLGRNLRWSELPEAVWAPNDGSWIIIDMKVNDPRQCQAMSFNDGLDQNINEWNEKIAKDGHFRYGRVPTVSAGRSSGWATTPVEDGFVQISLGTSLLSKDPFLSLSHLTAVRVGLSPASCKLFPSKCN